MESKKDDYRDRYNQLITDVEERDIVLSSSSLRQFAETPQHFIKYKLDKKEPTDAMKFGSLVHCLVLEEDKFEEQYALTKKLDMRTNKSKEFVANAAAQGMEVVEQDTYKLALSMANAVRYNDASSWIINNLTETEKEIFWDYKGFKFRGFIDGLGDGLMADLKVMKSANPRQVMRSIVDFKIHVQMVMYLKGLGRDMDTYIIAVDRNMGVSTHKFTAAFKRRGFIDYEYYMNEFNKCVITKRWDASYEFYSDKGYYDLDLPRWL